MGDRANFEHEVERFVRRLPLRVAGTLRRLRHPRSFWVRAPVAGVLLVGGVFGFLPVVGFWMLPVALLLIAQDMPFLRPPMARFLRWLHSKWPEPKPVPTRK